MTDMQTWPRLHRGVIESRFYLRAANLLSLSPFTGQRTVYGPNAQVWVAELTLPTKRSEQWPELSGRLARMDGISGLMRIPDYFRNRPARDRPARHQVAADEPFSDDTLFTDDTGFAAGTLPSSIAVAEAAARGADSFVVKGLPVSESRVLRTGDLVELRPSGMPAAHGHLYEMVNDANSDADGWTRLYVRPRLRAGIDSGDMAVLLWPHGVFRLADDGQAGFSRRFGNLADIGLSFIEELPRL